MSGAWAFAWSCPQTNQVSQQDIHVQHARHQTAHLERAPADEQRERVVRLAHAAPREPDRLGVLLDGRRERPEGVLDLRRARARARPQQDELRDGRAERGGRGGRRVDVQHLQAVVRPEVRDVLRELRVARLVGDQALVVLVCAPGCDGAGRASVSVLGGGAGRGGAGGRTDYQEGVVGLRGLHAVVYATGNPG